MIIAALRDVVGPSGTILGYTDWQGEDEIVDDPARPTTFRRSIR